MPQKRGESFGSLVAGVLEKQGLSYAEVAKALGHKSKTTLHRILNDDCTPATAERFYRAFLESGLCELHGGRAGQGVLGASAIHVVFHQQILPAARNGRSSSGKMVPRDRATAGS